ncbi:hypothetical protein BGZ83_001027 [Gryganskiella cystojenkinii]|nr:hypothetical protein BGZ83_001027 [Gryganskiella cystojenkinii]
MSSLKVQPLTSQNRAIVSQLIFDNHVRSVPSIFNFIKLRPIALVVWTAISTAIFKLRSTTLQNYSEILTVLAGSIIVTQGLLFLVLLYEATTQASGPQVVGKLNLFADKDVAATTGSSTSTLSKTDKKTAEKRATSSSSDDKSKNDIVPVTANNKDNQFWVLEIKELPVGCIGATIERSSGVAKLELWEVAEIHRRNGAGTLLLKTAMDQLSTKSSGIKTVRVILQGYQVPALRLFYKFGFQQVDRVPEWMGERVVLEISTKDWVKNQK